MQEADIAHKMSASSNITYHGRLSPYRVMAEPAMYCCLSSI